MLSCQQRDSYVGAEPWVRPGVGAHLGAPLQMSTIVLRWQLGIKATRATFWQLHSSYFINF
jgi:hypothetical protein